MNRRCEVMTETHKNNGIKSIWLLCINDLHAQLEEREGSPGGAKLVTAVREFSSAHENTVVLFGGDNYKGDPVSEHLKGKPVSAMMRMMKVRASAIGNHEFDFGMEQMKQWQEEGEYQFLAANLIENKTGRPPDFIKPFLVLERSGVRILLIGLVLPERLDTADRPGEMRDYHILDREQSIRRVREIIARHRTDIDAVVALTHYGLRYQQGTGLPSGEEAVELCRRVPELAGVFTAHLHQLMALQIYGAAVAQGGSKAQGLAYIRLEFARTNQLLRAVPGYCDLRIVQAELLPDRRLQTLWKSYKKTAMSHLGKRIARLSAPVYHRNRENYEVDPEGTPLSYLAVKIMSEETGCPIVLFYSGRIGLGFEAGDLTLYDCYRTLNFRNEIVTMKLSGAAIKANVGLGLRTLAGENASPIAVYGLKVRADFSKLPGERLVKLELADGSNLRPDKLYDVTMDEYMADNAMGFDFSSGTEITFTGVSLRDCMIAQIEREGNIETGFLKQIIDVARLHA